MKKNNTMNKIITLILLAFLTTSCWEDYKYPKGELPESPVNLESFNTEYDDYNSTAPSLGTLIPFCFSSNRSTEGGNFDIVYEPMNINWNKNTGILTVGNTYDNYSSYIDEYQTYEDVLDSINTSGNELGPYFIVDQARYSSEYNYLFMFATDSTGNYQINFTYKNEPEGFSSREEISFLNSEYNDLYPSFDMNYSNIYFCSDRDGDTYNIYSASLNRSVEFIVTELSDNSSREIDMQSTLSSGYNDKCPYIYLNVMVFASDRPGGEGGYDLYYSIYDEGTWSEPVNFGPGINSSYDEYRPIILNDMVDYERDMMIFSSNRPSGKGGFDLYYAGIESMGKY